jgi:hypothetical protein
MLPDRSPGAAAKVQDLGAASKSAGESVVPDSVVPLGILTVAVPLGRVLLVMCDNLLSELIRHSDEVGSCPYFCNGSILLKKTGSNSL